MADRDDVRLVATMGIMARESDNEALIALRQATRMLSDRGLRWDDVARMLVEGVPVRPKPSSRPQPADEPPPKPQEPSREERRARARTAQARAYDGSRPRRTVKGIDIPETISGRMIILAEEKRNRRGDEYVLVSIEGDDVVWGPMMVFDPHLRTMVHYLSDDRIEAEVQQPANSLYNPIITNIGHP